MSFPRIGALPFGQCGSIQGGSVSKEYGQITTGSRSVLAPGMSLPRLASRVAILGRRLIPTHSVTKRLPMKKLFLLTLSIFPAALVNSMACAEKLPLPVGELKTHADAIVVAAGLEP
jgi:hypothetical protein